jgi:hypothetical protein
MTPPHDLLTVETRPHILKPQTRVRGTPALAALDGFPSGPNPDASGTSDASGAFPSRPAPDTSDDFLLSTPDTSAPFYPTVKTPETSVRSR